MIKNLLFGLIVAFVVCSLATSSGGQDQPTYTYQGRRGDFRIKIVLTKQGQAYAVTGQFFDGTVEPGFEKGNERCPISGSYFPGTRRIRATVKCHYLFSDGSSNDTEYSLDGTVKGNGFAIDVYQPDGSSYVVADIPLTLVQKPPPKAGVIPPPSSSRTMKGTSTCETVVGPRSGEWVVQGTGNNGRQWTATLKLTKKSDCTYEGDFDWHAEGYSGKEKVSGEYDQETNKLTLRGAKESGNIVSTSYTARVDGDGTVMSGGEWVNGSDGTKEKPGKWHADLK